MKILLVIALISFPLLSQARTNCPIAEVEHIQIEGNVILYQQTGYNWRRLGTLDEAGTRERYSALLTAQASGRKVLVAYANESYDCNVVNYAESAYIVRIYK